MSAHLSLSAEAFALLEQDRSVSGGFTVRETEVRVSGGTVLHALYPERRALLIPLTPDDARASDEDSVNVTLSPRSLREPGAEESSDFLVLECASAPLYSTFNSLCDEILDGLQRTPRPEPARVCLDVLERWRALIGPSRDRLLSRQALAGVLAELHLLEHLAGRLGPIRGIDAWAATREGARHDFRLGNVSAEVKATTLTGRFVVGIHGLRQLETPDDGQLYLYAEQLEPVAEGEDSVPDSIERLVAVGVSRLRLLDALAYRGYRATEQDSYRQIRFTKLGSRTALVDDLFPALVPRALADPTLAGRLENVQYSLDITEMSAGDPDGTTLSALSSAFETAT